MFQTIDEELKTLNDDIDFDLKWNSKDPVVDDVFDNVEYPIDITRITVIDNDFGPDDIVKAVKEFIKKYFGIDKEIAWVVTK